MSVQVDPQQAQLLIQHQLAAIFESFERGEDVSPARLYRAEGAVALCCELGLISVDQAYQLMAQVYQGIYQKPFPYPASAQFSIPMLMKRAPVYPST